MAAVQDTVDCVRAIDVEARTFIIADKGSYVSYTPPPTYR